MNATKDRKINKISLLAKKDRKAVNPLLDKGLTAFFCFTGYLKLPKAEITVCYALRKSKGD